MRLMLSSSFSNAFLGGLATFTFGSSLVWPHGPSVLGFSIILAFPIRSGPVSWCLCSS
jgi:hypothetical protein